MKKANWFRVIILAGVVLLLAGCTQLAAPMPLTPNPLIETVPASTRTTPYNGRQPEPIPPLQGDFTPMTPSQIPPTVSGLEGLIEQAKEDLALRLAIPAAQIELIEASQVVWPDASLGCPQPGMRYIQVPEDGARIVLLASGRKYEYHTGGSRGLFLCELLYKDPNPPAKLDLGTRLPPITPDNSIPPGEDK